MLALPLALLSLAASVMAEEPEAPPLTYLFSVELEMAPAPIEIGRAPFGNRGILTITGGSFAGPKLNGTVANGLDWGITGDDGMFSPEAVYILTTDDGANIMVKESGHAPHVSLLFETGSEDYAWMNSIVAYATGGPTDTGVHLDAWQIN